MKKIPPKKKANSLHIRQSTSERNAATSSRSNTSSGRTPPMTRKKQTAMKRLQPRRPPHSDLRKPSSMRSSLPNPPLPETITSESPPNHPLLEIPPAKKLAPKRVLNKSSRTRDPMKFITDALDIEWNNYTKYLRAFLEKASVNNVRDLRVSIRRLMTSIDLIERFTPDNMLLRARATLKEQLSELSDLRDAHVEMVAARRFLKELPELKEFNDALLDRESSYLSAAKKLLSKSDKRFIENAINRVKIRLSTTRAITNATGAHKIIEAAIDSSFDVVNKKLEFVNLADYSTIHNVRLAFKPLRYMIEMLQPLIQQDRKKLGTARFLAV